MISDHSRINSPFYKPMDRLQNHLNFCYQTPLSFEGFWKQFSTRYFVTIPNVKAIWSLVIAILPHLKLNQSITLAITIKLKNLCTTNYRIQFFHATLNPDKPQTIYSIL